MDTEFLALESAGGMDPNEREIEKAEKAFSILKKAKAHFSTSSFGITAQPIYRMLRKYKTWEHFTFKQKQFVVLLRASRLKECRKQIENLRKNHSSWSRENYRKCAEEICHLIKLLDKDPAIGSTETEIRALLEKKLNPRKVDTC